VAKGCCFSCYDVVRKGKTLEETREWRKEHPVRGTKATGTAGEVTKSKEPSDKELDMTAIHIHASEKKHKITVAFDIDALLSISNVRIVGRWPNPTEQEMEEAAETK
jgi:hypothetical protein